MNADEERELCERLAATYSTGEPRMRRKPKLRQRAQLIYQCKVKHCVLGAVVVVPPGIEVWLYRQDVAVGTVSGSAIRRAQAEGASGPAGRGPMIREYGPGSSESESPLWGVPERIAESRAYGNGTAVTRGLRLTGVPLRFLEGGELEHSHVNCPHAQLVLDLDRVRADMQSVNCTRGKVVTI